MPIGTSDGQYFENEWDYTNNMPRNGIEKPAGESNPQEGSSDTPIDNWAKIAENSAGELQFYKQNYDDMKAHPEKYGLSIENMDNANSKSDVMDRMSRIMNVYARLHKGEPVTTSQMTDAMLGVLDHVQGIQALKGFLGMPNKTRRAFDNSIYMNPNES